MSRPAIPLLAFASLVALASAACGSDSSTSATAADGGAGAPSPDGGVAPPNPDASVDAAADASSPGPRPTTCTGRLAQPLDKVWTLTVGGQARTLNVHVPAMYDPTKATPIVLNFHGFTSNGQQEDLLAQMSQKSDKEGFIAVHPDGLQSSWNAGACCGYATQNNVDDVGFVNAILDALEAALCVDTQRVFSTGMSNGGFFSHRLGCELSSRIAAIAPVAGVLGMPACAPSRPVPVMEFHGTADGLVPYNGNAGMGFPSVPDTFAGWAARDKCTGAPTETFRNGDSHCATYAGCDGGATVTLCTVDNGGHTWPGGTPVPSLGYTTTYLSATDAMWEFFVKHPMP